MLPGSPRLLSRLTLYLSMSLSMSLWITGKGNLFCISFCFLLTSIILFGINYLGGIFSLGIIFLPRDYFQLLDQKSTRRVHI